MSATTMPTACQGNVTCIDSATYSGINSGQYISGQSIIDQSVHYIYYCLSPSGPYPGIDVLLNASAPNAAVDAKVRAYSPRCFPGTRKQYIKDITSWATASSNDPSLMIYRMTGPAGVGKTTIAQTCVEGVKKQGKLGAAFFFSINGCSDHMRFFTSIAYQLSTVLPEYKQILNDRILNDRTIVDKTIASQFEGLIIKPLQELKRLGREVGMRTIFIDGLDECQSPDAQSQIIELIAASVRDQTMPFRWAFFSRAEVHIEASFTLDFVIPLCYTIELPISRKADKEIKLYLEGGFKNILRQQSLSFSSPWPTAKAIQKLVEASAGLYAYPAAVLRFIEFFPAGGPKEALAAVLDVISQASSHADPLSPFAELDAFYMLIMQRIPGYVLPSVRILFAIMAGYGCDFDPDSTFNIAIIFNGLRLSEAGLNAVRRHLHAVVYFQDAPPTLKLDSDINITRRYYEQRLPSHQEEDAILSSLGTMAFHHKSFYDFLADPARSASFCVSTPEMELKVFECYFQTHFDLAQSYVVQGTELVSTSDVPNYSAALSFPLNNEYVNSHLQDYAFVWCTSILTFLPWNTFFERIPRHSLQKLSEIDYRKYFLVLLRLSPGFSASEDPGSFLLEFQTAAKSRFRRFHPNTLQSSHYIKLLSLQVKLFGELGIIKPYRPTFASKLAHFIQAKQSRSEHSGLFTLGRGDKAVFWFWEFNIDTKEHYEFLTLDIKRAMEIFESNKYDMWTPDWTLPRP